jgi:hypothetical protein
VIGGPGAFMIAAQSYETFADAILKKLIAEIAGISPDVIPGRRQKRVYARLRRAMAASPESITTGADSLLADASLPAGTR